MDLHENEQIYYGEIRCQAKNKSCRNKGYFSLENGDIVCGVHSRNVKKVELPHRNIKEVLERKSELYDQHEKYVEKIAEQNRKNDVFGQVKLIQMKMRKEVELIPGYMNVFPNFRHQNRKDGFGCSSLSPMMLGPVIHNQPDCPPSKNLENYHQFSKCFPLEVDEEQNPTLDFVQNRIKGFEDTEPHRHKILYSHNNLSMKGIKPLYSLWTNLDGETHAIDYISSRQFYCVFYERLASVQEDFKYLKDLVEEGFNIAIQGYDAFEMGQTEDEIETAYLSPHKPFGHERCLMTMLVLNDPSKYPWNKHKTYDF